MDTQEYSSLKDEILFLKEEMASLHSRCVDGYSELEEVKRFVETIREANERIYTHNIKLGNQIEKLQKKLKAYEKR